MTPEVDPGQLPTPQPAEPPESPAPSFEVGDVVRLKSGGPCMTVQRGVTPHGSMHADRGNIVVAWVSFATAEVRTHSAPPECFAAVDPTENGLRPVSDSVGLRSGRIIG